MTNDLILIEQHAVEPFMKNGYLLSCGSTLQTTYIDPGAEAPELLRRIEEQNLDLISIINTHAHMDHICGIKEVKEKWDVPIYLHPEDAELYKRLPTQAKWFGMEQLPPPPFDYSLNEGEDLSVGDLLIRVYYTPGHSPGSVSFEVENHIFCGDAIFAGSIGRTDLPGGDCELLMESIYRKILPLGDEKILHPGHGPETTIERERTTNPFLTGSVHLTDN